MRGLQTAGDWAPEFGRPPVLRQDRRVSGNTGGFHGGSTYEAGSHSHRTRGWVAPTSTPNPGILSNITTLRGRSRAATRNDGIAKGFIDKLVTNVIGTGIKPLSQVADPALRKQLQAVFARWVDESDADGLLDWYGQQAQAVRGWFEGGEVFIRLRPRLASDGLSVPMQMQVIEPELCPHTYNLALANGNRVRAGIEFNQIGQRTAYYFYNQRPGDLLDFDPSDLRRVPASSVIHLYDPLRPGQLRGLPILTQALLVLYDLDQTKDFILQRTKLGNLFTGFLTHTGAPEADVNPLTGEEEDNEAHPEPVSLESGAFHELRQGEDVTFSEPPDPPVGLGDFMRYEMLAACAGVGVPYEILTGDMRNLNDRLVRVIINEFRARVQTWQYHVVAYALCRRVWLAWMSRAFLAGAINLPAEYIENPAAFTAVKWTPPRAPYIHPVQDVEAQKEAIRNGFTTRSAVVSEYGEDAEAIDEEQRKDNERADGMALRYDSDGRFADNIVPTPPPSDPASETAPTAQAIAIDVTTHAPDVHVAQAAQPAPVINVEVHPAVQQPPIVNVTVAAAEGPKAPRMRKMMIKRDAENRMTEVVEEPIEEPPTDGQ